MCACLFNMNILKGINHSLTKLQGGGNNRLYDFIRLTGTRAIYCTKEEVKKNHHEGILITNLYLENNNEGRKEEYFPTTKNNVSIHNCNDRKVEKGEEQGVKEGTSHPANSTSWGGKYPE